MSAVAGLLVVAQSLTWGAASGHRLLATGRLQSPVRPLSFLTFCPHVPLCRTVGTDHLREALLPPLSLSRHRTPPDGTFSWSCCDSVTQAASPGAWGRLLASVPH